MESVEVVAADSLPLKSFSPSLAILVLHNYIIPPSLVWDFLIPVRFQTLG